MRLLHALYKEYTWVHLMIGIVGNVCFFLGSVFFLYKSLKTAGVWLFILGAGGMLIGKLGSAMVEWRVTRERSEGYRVNKGSDENG